MKNEAKLATVLSIALLVKLAMCAVTMAALRAPAPAPAEPGVENRVRVGLLTVSWSPDGESVATAGYLYGAGEGLRVWDVTRGLFRVVIAQSVIAAAYSPDGKRIAYATAGTLSELDLATGWSRLLGQQRSPILHLATSPDGKWIATAHQDGSVRAWSTSGAAPRMLGRAARGDTDTVAWSPDSRTVASGGDDQALRLWDLAGGEARSFSHTGTELFGLAWSPDDKTLASAASNDTGSPHLWTVATGERTSLAPARGGVPYAAAFSPDGSAVALACANGSVNVYGVRERTSRELVRLDTPAYAVAYSPDGMRLAIGAGDGVLHVVDAR